MTKSDQIIIKQEFDKSIKYLAPRRDKEILTVGECMKEIGHLRMFIFNLGINEKKRNEFGQEILT
jgi:hypothetical protein